MEKCNANKALQDSAFMLRGYLSERAIAEHYDWADSTDSVEDLCSNCTLARDQIRSLVDVVRDLLAEKAGDHPIRGFDGKYRFLSNFANIPVEYNGFHYLNAEAAFHAQKCLSRAKEFVGLNPSQAKRLGRQVPLRQDWEQVKEAIMYEIVTAKFAQNLDAREKLLDTGYSRLYEENNWGDKTWGVVNGKGMNLLGIILEDVRDELRPYRR